MEAYQAMTQSVSLTLTTGGQSDISIRLFQRPSDRDHTKGDERGLVEMNSGGFFVYFS